ncbi:unnamed protein product [Amoebophrya sp. A120]|nr:unnamed protein product [Amoebophrya sp. A120]|eukprot:GSA120T00011366001.1
MATDQRTKIDAVSSVESEAAKVGRVNMIRPEDIACTTEAQAKHLAAFQAGSKDWLSYQHEAEDPAEIRAAEEFLRHVLCLLVEQVLTQRLSNESDEARHELEQKAKQAIAFLQQVSTGTSGAATTATHTPASSRGESPLNSPSGEEIEVEDHQSCNSTEEKVVSGDDVLVIDVVHPAANDSTSDGHANSATSVEIVADFLNAVTEKHWDDAVRNARRHFQCAPPKSRLVKTLSQLVFESVLPRGTAVERILKKKSVRSNSGVVVITVVTAPGKFSCPHDCYYCPDEPGQPRSYLSTEPAVQRANQNNFDPVKQFYDRAATLAKQGHEVDKVEIIVLGGTWSAYSKEYQDQFCRDLFYAANTFLNEDDLRRGKSSVWDLQGRERMSLPEEQRLNELSECKIIGLTLETRPDHITKAEVRRLRLLGCTRVQIGVQHTDDEILKKVNRGHSVNRAVKAVSLLKTAGFKVDIHLMPDLPGATPDADWEMFKYVLNSDALQADHWKIYPCEVTPFTQIEKWHSEGSYTPYTDTDPDTMIRLLCNVKVNVHPWIRLNRVIRDIPEVSIIAGNQNTNLRQVLFDQLSKCGESCKCTRCREVRRYGEPLDQLVVRVRKYRSSNGWEFFCSVEGSDRGLGGGAEKRATDGKMSRKQKKQANKQARNAENKGKGKKGTSRETATRVGQVVGTVDVPTLPEEQEMMSFDLFDIDEASNTTAGNGLSSDNLQVEAGRQETHQQPSASKAENKPTLLANLKGTFNSALGSVYSTSEDLVASTRDALFRFSGLDQHIPVPSADAGATGSSSSSSSAKVEKRNTLKKSAIQVHKERNLDTRRQDAPFTLLTATDSEGPQFSSVGSPDSIASYRHLKNTTSSDTYLYKGKKYDFHCYQDARKYVNSANVCTEVVEDAAGDGSSGTTPEEVIVEKNRDNGALYGLLRLRLNDDPSAVREMFPELENSALIRELHVYGEVRPVYRADDKNKTAGVTLNDDPTLEVEQEVVVGSTSGTCADAAASAPAIAVSPNDVLEGGASSSSFREPRSYYRRKHADQGKQGSAQHGGIGKLLMCVAETIAQRHGSKKIAVISGVGVRNYYRKLGYEQLGVGRYLIKPLEEDALPADAGSAGLSGGVISGTSSRNHLRNDDVPLEFLDELEIPFAAWQDHGPDALPQPCVEVENTNTGVDAEPASSVVASFLYDNRKAIWAATVGITALTAGAIALRSTTRSRVGSTANRR